jgi:3-hydroxybutyryl-CoA dehydrogenase
VTTNLADLTDAPVVVEAIVEELDPKVELLSRLGAVVGPQALLATTTSSLSVAELGALWVWLGASSACTCSTPSRGWTSSRWLSRTGCPTTCGNACSRSSTSSGRPGWRSPTRPGFVVNRLLFPYLRDAVHLLERQGARPEDLDRCMTLGAGHPLGPFALLDMVGLDVSRQIMVNLGLEVPSRVEELVAAGRTGRKAGAGFYDYGTT